LLQIGPIVELFLLKGAEMKPIQSLRATAILLVALLCMQAGAGEVNFTFLCERPSADNGELRGHFLATGRVNVVKNTIQAVMLALCYDDDFCSYKVPAADSSYYSEVQFTDHSIEFSNASKALSDGITDVKSFTVTYAPSDLKTQLLLQAKQVEAMSQIPPFSDKGSLIGNNIQYKNVDMKLRTNKTQAFAPSRCLITLDNDRLDP